jgi:hypothetical protein
MFHIKLKKSEKIRIAADFRNKIIESVVKKLGVKDYFKLKDRMDGEFYLNKQIKRIYPSYFLEKSVKINLLKKDKPLYCKSEFEYESVKYSVVGTFTPNKIKVPIIDNTDYYLVIYINDQPNYTEYLGFLSKNDVKKLQKKKTNLNSNNLVVNEPLLVIKSEDLR